MSGRVSDGGVTYVVADPRDAMVQCEGAPATTSATAWECGGCIAAGITTCDHTPGDIRPSDAKDTSEDRYSIEKCLAHRKRAETDGAACIAYQHVAYLYLDAFIVEHHERSTDYAPAIAIVRAFADESDRRAKLAKQDVEEGDAPTFYAHRFAANMIASLLETAQKRSTDYAPDLDDEARAKIWFESFGLDPDEHKNDVRELVQLLASIRKDERRRLSETTQKRSTDYAQVKHEAMVWRAVATGFRLALSDIDDDGTEALEHALEDAQTAFNDAVHAHGHPNYPDASPKRSDP